MRGVVGMKFGMLTVVQYNPGRMATCVCLCSCGRSKVIRYSSLTAGFTKSCGCFRRNRMVSMNFKHGDAVGGPSVEWVIWRAMRQRCEDFNHKSFKDYGGRGITVCDRWHDFKNFLQDMGRRPAKGLQIDRIDNLKGYCPGNCRWVTPKENSNNRRKPKPRRQTKNHEVEVSLG